MIIQNRDGSLIANPAWDCDESCTHEHCYADVPAAPIEEQSSLVERIIALALDVIGARHVEVRVHQEEC